MLTELYNFQKDIVNKVLENTESTLIQLPTGGGKTIISKEIVIGLINKKNKKILFIVPKNILMEQTLKTFEGLKPQKVHGSNKFDKNHDISVSTLQTAPNRDLNPDVIIIDEVHFGYEKKMLNDIMANNPKARIIGLSATPYDSNGYLLKGFDVILNQYDMEYMIKNKYLVPLRSFILVKPDLSNVSIIAGDYELSQLSEAVSKYPIIMEIVKESKSFIEKSIKTIVFAVDINHAELLKTAFQNEGFTTEALHSKSEEDKTVIKRFEKGYIKILVSVLKLTTGFNVPETDLAIIARPTKSQNLYKQMVGRVLRTVDFKKTGINKKYAILLDCGNVIKNLGKPLASIVPKDELERKVQKLLCKKCNSENIKLKKSKEKEVLYWECLDCGEKRNLENRNLYQCENCNKKYSYDNGDFELINSSLYLNCECGYETEISIATGDEEFKEVDSGIDIEIDKIEYLSCEDVKTFIQEDDTFFPFEEARKFVRSLNLKKKNRWEDYKDRLLDTLPESNLIPKNPEIIYAQKGWIDFEDWLGIENPENYLLYEDAKLFAERLRFDNKMFWYQFAYDSREKFPSNIPKKPEVFYNNKGWKNWEEWLGRNEPLKISTNNKYLDFYQARAIIRKLNLSNEDEYYNFRLKNNKNEIYNKIPKIPDEYYKDKGWVNWSDWLGEIIPLLYEDQKKFVKSLKINSQGEWEKYQSGTVKTYGEFPTFLSRNPQNKFYKEWISWEDWLGIDILNYKCANKFVKKLNLNSKDDWILYRKGKKTDLPKMPNCIPQAPLNTYKNNGWVSWEDWLGK